MTFADHRRCRVLLLRKRGLCECGARLVSKARCLDCLVRQREAARRRERAKQKRECLSRKLERKRCENEQQKERLK